MPIDDFDLAIAPLKDLGGQRVWSLMISLFGDMARQEGQIIGGPVLSAIMTAMDVRPEAARVALHRLRKDKWIASEKHGRISHHSLTPAGRAQSQAASGRIYATPAELPEHWQMIVTEDADSDAPEKAGFTALMPRLYVGNASLPVPKGAAALPGQDAPDWMKRQLEPASLAESYTQLSDALHRVARDLSAAETLSPLQIATLRCLIVHNWRRLALKHPALPRPLIRDDWAGLTAHQMVAELLSRYPRPDLPEIATV